MVCEKRERDGVCEHTQCPYPGTSGVDCVDVIRGYCECGDDCHPDCEFAWDGNDIPTRCAARFAFQEHYGEFVD
jgi:hypothetical protein